MQYTWTFLPDCVSAFSINYSLSEYLLFHDKHSTYIVHLVYIHSSDYLFYSNEYVMFKLFVSTKLASVTDNSREEQVLRFAPPSLETPVPKSNIYRADQILRFWEPHLFFQIRIRTQSAFIQPDVPGTAVVVLTKLQGRSDSNFWAYPSKWVKLNIQ